MSERRTVVRVAIAAAVGLALALTALAFLPTLLAPLQGPLYDNRPSGVACEDLPPRGEVERSLRENQDLAQRIEAAGDNIRIDIAVPCPDDYPDRAEIEVTYPGGGDRERIEKMLEDGTFAGVPTTLRNV